LLLLILSLSSAAFSVVWILAFHIFLAMKSREAKQIGGGKEIYVMVDRTKRGL
jgi:4-hydroxybenzoate polyprenyltransferase